MKLRNLRKGATLVAVSALLTAIVTLLGLVAFVFYNSNGGRDWSTPMEKISDALVWEGGNYSFTGDEWLDEEHWVMLLNQEGWVVWSFRKPEDIPEQYNIADVASFTRWYLCDYPVQCWIRKDGLLVVGSPKGSIWKHDIAMSTQVLLQTPIWFLCFFLLALGGVLGLTWMVGGRWFRQEQQVRDAARSDWINGVSHDIRTPLSIVMGYAAQLEKAPDLTLIHKRQASIIRVQSQVIRDLVNDLNLTMRLDCEMQALRKESLQPVVFLRQLAADFLNGGMGSGFDLELEFPEEALPEIEADPFLLRRAMNNLLTNCVRHNDHGCSIHIGVRAEGAELVLWVEGGTMAGTAFPDASHSLETDGGAAHGTGLRLVAQIAAAHGGKAEFRSGIPYRCELRLPVSVKE